MSLFPVYNLLDLEIVKGKGTYVWDAQGKKYLDFYGGHAVISIGHCHPNFVKGLSQQLRQLPFYSNSVHLPIQNELSTALNKISKCKNFQLFLCNSGAEANENAIKLASFTTGKKKIIAFKKGFHGRTHGAVTVTDNKKIKAPINTDRHVVMLPFNDVSALKKAFVKHKNGIAAVIVEPIQGIAGINVASDDFLLEIQKLCNKHSALFIADEVQSGFGRSGKFFAHQYAKVTPDIISMAKGMGNGFPIGGILIHPTIEAWKGMLGSTFGGNPLACAAALAVIRTIKEEQLLKHSIQLEKYLMKSLSKVPAIQNVSGKGLMIGIELAYPIAALRKALIFKHRILTGNASNPNILRILPPLNIKKEEIDRFIKALLKETDSIDQ